MTVDHAALTFLIVLVLFELVRLVRLHLFVRKLPSEDERKSAFTWFHQSARNRVVALILNILAFAYVLFPLFFSVGRAAQDEFVLPLFATISSRFNELVFDAARTYGNILLEGGMAVSFERMRQAYAADTGAGAIWLDILLPLLPFLFFAWTIALMTRLFVPLVLALGGAKSALQVLRVSIIVSLSGTAFQQIAVRLFHVDTSSAVTWALLVAFALTFSLYLRQAMTMAPAGTKCPKGHLNPKSSKFCNECGERLQHSPTE